MYHYTGQEGIVCRFSIRPPLIVAYKTLAVSRDLKLIKDSHPKYVISMSFCPLPFRYAPVTVGSGRVGKNLRNLSWII